MLGDCLEKSLRSAWRESQGRLMALTGTLSDCTQSRTWKTEIRDPVFPWESGQQTRERLRCCSVLRLNEIVIDRCWGARKCSVECIPLRRCGGVPGKSLCTESPRLPRPRALWEEAQPQLSCRKGPEPTAPLGRLNVHLPSSLPRKSRPPVWSQCSWITRVC